METAALLEQAEPLVLSDPRRARELLHGVRGAAEINGDQHSLVTATCLLAGCDFFMADYPAARSGFTEALAQARSIGAHALEARCLNGMGLAHQKTGDYGEAMEFFLESLRLAQELGDEWGRIRAVSNIAAIHAELDEPEQALTLHLDAMTSARSSGHPIYEAATMSSAVMDYFKLGRFAESFALSQEALERVRELGLRQYEGVIRTYRARNLLELGRAGEALQECQDVLPHMHDIGDRDYICQVMMVRGAARFALNDVSGATTELADALKLAQEIGTKTQAAQIHEWLSRVLEAQGDLVGALEHARAHHQLERIVHARDADHKTRALSAQVRVELLKREAEVERLRNVELAQMNLALQEAQRHLSHQAMHDPLTGLANRAYFQQELRRLLLGQNGQQAVLFVDLDRFKQINDSLGHAVGDELLQQVAMRLCASVRGADLVARMGGDEFTVLLHQVRNAENAERVARKLLTSLAAPFELQGRELHVTASVGIALAPGDGHDVETLQRHADIAMYRAKREGRGVVRRFERTMAEGELERLELERELRGALRERQLVLHYQGQFDVQSGALVGFEALVRWQHPVRGLVPPGAFIPLAEDSGLIVPIGEWVLREACLQAAAWSGCQLAPGISVNVSPLQFEQPNFVGSVRQALHLSGLAPSRLTLELTESLVMGNVERAMTQLKSYNFV